MMAAKTSLSAQLKQLSAPQTSVLRQDKKKPSILFNPREAANLDTYTVFQIGLSGLEELILLRREFHHYRRSLFSEATLTLERSVQTKDANKTLSQEVESFLALLAPFLLLRPAQKALEWLVHRLQVHRFEYDALMLAALAYHHTRFFARIVALVGQVGVPTSRWHWLKPMQRSGLPLAKETIASHASTSPEFLLLLSTRADTNMFVTTALMVLENRRCLEEHMATLLPYIKRGISSGDLDLRAGAYMIAAKAATVANLSISLHRNIIKWVLLHCQTSGTCGTNEALLLLTLMQQQETEVLPKTALLVGKVAPLLADAFGDISEWCWVLPLLKPWLLALLECGEKKAAITLVVKIRVPNADAYKLICSVMKSYIDGNSRTKYLINSYLATMSCLTNKYPESADRAIRDVVSALDPEKLESVRYILGLNPGSVSENAGLYHAEPTIRAEAVRGIMASGAPRVKLEAIRARIHDEDPQVVAAILESDWNQLIGAISEEALVLELTRIAGHEGGGSWMPVRIRAVTLLGNAAPQYMPDILLATLSSLFPLKHNGKELANTVLQSFGTRSAMLQYLCNKIGDTHAMTHSSMAVAVFRNCPKAVLLLTSEEREELISRIRSLSRHVTSSLLLLSWLLGDSPELAPLVATMVQDGINNGVVLRKGGALNANNVARYCHLSAVSLQVALYALQAAARNVKRPVLKLWWGHHPSDYVMVLQTAFEVASAGCSSKKPELYRESLAAVFGAIPKGEHLDFLSGIWCTSTSTPTRLRALLVASEFMRCGSTNAALLPSLLVAAMDQEASVRVATMRCMSQVQTGLVLAILKVRQEVEADQTYLKTSVTKFIAGSHATETMLLDIVASESTPPLIVHGLLEALSNHTSDRMMLVSSKLAQRLIAEENPDMNSLKLLLARITVDNSVNHKVFIAALTSTNQSVVTTMLEVIDRQWYSEVKVPVMRQKILSTILTLSAAGNSNARSALKRIRIHADDAVPELSSILDFSTIGTKRRRRSWISGFPNDLVGKPKWQRMVALLEMLQGKKKLIGSPALMPALNSIVKACLAAEMQSAASEYVLQLALTILRRCGDDGGELDAALLVSCLRSSVNPQTHHQALMALAMAARKQPNGFMHHLIPLFTFVGSSLVRQDDSYTFQLIKNTIESIVPVLVSDGKHVNEVLRIFAMALQDVPDHRRLGLYRNLIDTMGTDLHLWLFMVQVFRVHVTTVIRTGKPDLMLEFLQTLLQEWGAAVQLDAALKVIRYARKKAFENPMPSILRNELPDLIFNIAEVTPKQRRHFVYVVVTFVSVLMRHEPFLAHVAEAGDMSSIVRNLLEALLILVDQSNGAAGREPDRTKYWHTLALRALDAVEGVLSLLPDPTQFGQVMAGLLQNGTGTVRRRGAEILCSAIHRFSASPQQMTGLIPALIKEVERYHEDDGTNAQMALMTLKLMCRNGAPPDGGIALLQVTTILLAQVNASVPLLSSGLLALAEAVTVLRAMAVVHIPKFMPAALGAIGRLEGEVALQAAATSLHRIVEHMHHFLNPYLVDIVVLVVHWEAPSESQLGLRLRSLRKLLSHAIGPRLLLPALAEAYRKSELSATKNQAHHQVAHTHIATVLSELVSFVSPNDIIAHRDEILSLFLTLLRTPDSVTLCAFGNWVMQMSESQFRPVFFKLMDWASDSEKLIALYQLLSELARRLQSLFVLFAPNLLPKASEVLMSEPSASLLHDILSTLHVIFLHAPGTTTATHLDKMTPVIVGLLERTLSDEDAALLATCIGALAFSVESENGADSVQHQVLLKTRHQDASVRIRSVHCIVEIAAKLGPSRYPSLLPQVIPFLAELLEDEDETVEAATHNIVRKLEEMLGESLEKYF